MTLQKTSLIVGLRFVLQPDVSVESGYALISTLLIAPYLFSLFLVLWNVPFLRKSRSVSLPSGRNVVLGVFASIVESSCVVLFTSRVVAILPVFVALPATSGVLVISSVISAFNKGKRRSGSLNITAEEIPKPAKEKSFLCMGARITASITCTLVSPAAGCFLYVMNLSDIVTSLSLAVIPIMLGLVWNPDFQSHVLDPSGADPLCHRRLRLLYGIVKIVAIVVFILMEMYFRTDVSQTHHLLERYAYGFSVFKRLDVVFALVVHFLSCLICFGFSYVSLALCQPMFGVVIPSLFSMVSSLVLCLTLSAQVYGIDETAHFGSFASFLICASILAWAWAWPYILNASIFLRKPQCLLTPYKALFKGYGWNPIFYDQKFLLGYDSSSSSEAALSEVKVTNRIYICTTMYREADYEMGRLLESLMKISSDPLLKGIHFESNIFMDNGCSGTKLNEFALQFVALLITKGGVHLERTRCWVTPYGLQVFCQLPSGLPLFVHLKDPQKVKSKKRWSQAMYINYVMRFRKALWKYDSENKPVSSRECQLPEIRISSACNEADLIGYVSGNDQPLFRRITNIGFPTLADFKTTVENDRQYPSAEDSSPPHSEFGSQCQASCSSKESSDIDSLPDDKLRYYPGGAYINSGYQSHSEGGSNCSSCNGDSGDIQKVPPATPTPPDSDHNTVHSYTDVISDGDAYVDDDHTFILATDADMDFKADAIKELLNMCITDKRIGAACGRTHPIGQKCSSIVWHQVFEYAKDFWMIKNAQNIIGSVSCCPGCFSLYRANAIKDVMDKYSSPTKTPFTVYVKDTGEDRWMATLMMINGWHMRYSPFADNTTYCPDTFEEYYKQRRRWILSDMANAILVVQNLLRLVRNNECFSLMYVIYLVNMFLNNVITPGTAIVMITAGLELVFEIPYVYTTLPMAVIVYLYAFVCTCTSARTQGLLTSVLMVLMGSMFSSVAIYGSYKITAGMAAEIKAGHFHFQQHYVILLLTLSLVYAALMHPRESHQIIYGFAYLFIFPAMHVLLPIYSIANIIDQSWGTRDSNEAKLPKISCLPSFKKMRKRTKNSKLKGIGSQNLEMDTQTEIQTILSSLARDMSQGDEKAREEHKFWESLVATHLGIAVNQGLEKAALAEGLGRLRNRLLAAFLFLNAVWLAFLSYFYMGLDSPLSRLNIYGIISGALYGFTLIIQILGLTAGRIEQVLRKLATYVHGDDMPVWVKEKEDKSK
ncbi:chitin synthase chs-2-like isoform X2 [Biomphalaria pfeifferi]|uniref:chitin synthase n=1 Tax=Biomphalaria pfeifferi TaxID=112525 RepID=A0AAD8F8G7_BIOPF|nr:chitin synthase chs-2-like isoform X2 [Biomphalaria pfeifferi]